MKKFAPLALTAFAVMAFAGCAAETGSPSETTTAEDSAAACLNPDGTNAAIAVLAEAITHELHRWQITTDFSIGTGSYNQQVLKLTAAGLAACGGACPETQNILAFQDAMMDGLLVIDGTKVSSYNFASRVVTGWGNQWTCQGNTTVGGGGRCPFPAHTFDLVNGQYVQPTLSAGPCDQLYTHPVSKPASQGGGALTAAQVNQLANALTWTTGNGPNPYIAFQGTASTVSIDPGGNMNIPNGSDQTTYGCNINSPDVVLTGAPCTCPTQNITSGVLRITQPVRAKTTYFCVAS